jgi:hypothetical protein
MNQTTRQELLVSLLKAIKDSSAETKKQLANELYLSASELDDLLESAEGDQFIMTNYELLEFLNALDDVGYFYLGEL